MIGTCANSIDETSSTICEHFDRGPLIVLRIGPAIASVTHQQTGFALSRSQQTELVAIGICHHHPADLPLTDVDASRPEGDEPVDLR